MNSWVLIIKLFSQGFIQASFYDRFNDRGKSDSVSGAL